MPSKGKKSEATYKRKNENLEDQEKIPNNKNLIGLEMDLERSEINSENSENSENTENPENPGEDIVDLEAKQTGKITAAMLLHKAKKRLWNALDRNNFSASYVDAIIKLCVKELPAWQENGGQLITVETFKTIQKNLIQEATKIKMSVLTREEAELKKQAASNIDSTEIDDSDESDDSEEIKDSEEGKENEAEKKIE